MSNSGPNPSPDSPNSPDRSGSSGSSGLSGSSGGDRQKEKRQQRLTLGQLGEDLTADWIASQGGKILERRWRCRRGELDLVALMPDGPRRFLLAFVEVKTRSRSNWDEGGLLSITPAKQRKLWHSAQLYLSQAPRYAPLPCRFDVALIQSQKQKPPQKKAASAEAIQLDFTNPMLCFHGSQTLAESPKISQPVQRGGYRLTLQHYLTDAFRMD